MSLPMGLPGADEPSRQRPLMTFSKLRCLRLSLRTEVTNPDHHLWNNHGTWWCHFTVHSDQGQKCRIRRSLRTLDLHEARRRRDRLLQRLAGLAALPSSGRPEMQATPPVRAT